MNIYLRHGDKAYNNNSNVKYSLDSPLSDKGIQQVKNGTVKLIESVGFPDKIYVSPLLRTRMTACIIQNILLQQFGIFIPIIIDPTLSEYLGNQWKKNIKDHVYPETWNNGIVLQEYYKEFQKRVAKHWKQVCTSREICNYSHRKSKYTLYITHGLFIKELAEQIIKNSKSNKICYPDSFNGILIDKFTITNINTD